MTTERSICRPGHGASCALCCCSHNYRAPYAEIDALFERRAALLSQFSRGYLIGAVRGSRSDMTGSYYFRGERVMSDVIEKRVENAFQCPFVGYIDGERTVGCVLYPDEHKCGAAFDCHQVYRSKRFTCAARDTLSESEYTYAARLCGDWYHYGALIHMPDFLGALMREHPDVRLVSFDARRAIFARIEGFIMQDDALHRIDSYFG